MAKQITQLPVAASVAASDVFPLDQSGTTKQATLTAIAAGLPAGTGTGGLVRQTNPDFDGNVAVEDPALPFFQTNNTSAPADKKFTRFSHSATGAVQIERVNDAYTVATPLISWDASNNATFINPVSVNSTAATLATFFGSPGAGGFCGVRMVCGDASASNTRTAFIDIANETGTNVASVFGLVATDGSSTVTILTTPAGSRASDRRVERVRVTSDGNLAVGTTSAPSRLTVAGDVRLLNNTNALIFTDNAGSTPYFHCQSDNHLAIYGTNSTGGGRAILSCVMRSDTEPLRVYVPLKIGVNSASINDVYTAVVTHTPATIAANGGVQFLDVTVTGLTAGCNLFVNSFSLSNNSILVRAEFQANNTARIYWVNPTASPVTLSSAMYRVSGIVFA